MPSKKKIVVKIGSSLLAHSDRLTLPVDNPAERLDWLVTHRKTREAAILAALQQAPADAATLAQAIYTETPPALLGAATRNVLAHLVDLTGKSIIAPRGEMSARAVFEPV